MERFRSTVRPCGLFMVRKRFQERERDRNAQAPVVFPRVWRNMPDLCLFSLGQDALGPCGYLRLCVDFASLYWFDMGESLPDCGTVSWLLCGTALVQFLQSGVSWPGSYSGRAEGFRDSDRVGIQREIPVW